jgi:hypothetical protein
MGVAGVCSTWTVPATRAHLPPDPCIPAATSAFDPYPARGRGLQIVDQPAARWGYRNHQNGKAVWATLDLCNLRPTAEAPRPASRVANHVMAEPWASAVLTGCGPPLPCRPSPAGAFGLCLSRGWRLTELLLGFLAAGPTLVAHATSFLRS